MRLLIVEDENTIAEPLKKALEKRNFSVDIANDGVTGYKKATINNYDCIILDLNLPGMDGIEVAKRLKVEHNRTPILMVTARTMRQNVYEGFEAGTDDYLTKPFDFKELLYRLEALIKRAATVDDTIIKFAGLSVDTRALKVRVRGRDIPLNAKEYGILEYLLRNKGKVVSQEELLEHVWNEEIDSFTQTVRTNIKTLRRKIDPDKTIIKTYKGKGYVIE
jgi:two-component system, OmpR family, response regulator